MLVCLAQATVWGAEGPPPPQSQPQPPQPPKQILYLQAAAVMPIGAPVIPNGVVIVAGDKITAVGGPELEPPVNAKVLRFPNATLMPGFVDAASAVLATEHELASVSGSDPSRTAIDGVDPFSSEWKHAVKEGVCAAYLSLGPQTTIAGSGAVIRLGGGLFRNELVLRAPANIEAAICPGASSFGSVASEDDFDYSIDWELGKARRGDGAARSSEDKRSPASAEESAKPPWDAAPAADVKPPTEVAPSTGTQSAAAAPKIPADAPPDDDETEIIIFLSRNRVSSSSGGPSGFDLLRGYRDLRGYLERARSYQRARKWFDQDVAAWEREVTRMRKEEAEAQAQGKPVPRRPAPPRPPEPPRDAVGEAFLPVLGGTARLRVWAEREEEIRLALALGREYKITLVLCGAVEAYRIVKDIADARAQVVLFPRPAGYSLGKDLRPSRGNVRALFDAGIQFGFGSGTHARSGAHLLRHLVACEIARGLEPDYALRTVTLTNAEIAGVADRVGSIAAGKEANLVVFDGPPFATASKVLCAIVAGKIVVQEGSGEDASKK